MVTVSFIKLPLRSGANERHRIIDVILCLYSQVLLHIFPDIPAEEKHEEKETIHWHRSKCRKQSNLRMLRFYIYIFRRYFQKLDVTTLSPAFPLLVLQLGNY